MARSANQSRWYPAVAILTWIIPLVGRVGQALGWQSASFDQARTFFFYIQGFFDALAFCYSSKSLQYWKLYISGEIQRYGSSGGENQVNKTSEFEISSMNKVDTSSVISSLHMRNTSDIGSNYNESTAETSSIVRLSGVSISSYATSGYS